MSLMNLEKTRHDMVRVARWMHQRGLVGGMDGNLSVRVAKDRFLATPSGVNKGLLEASDLILTDGRGFPVRGKGSPSSELKMHLRIYEVRPDVGAVLHAHPPHCVACTLVGLSLTSLVVPELAYSLGAVPTASYATPGTVEVPESIEPYIAGSQAILLARHGAVTFGRDLTEAYNRLEGLEHAARILFLARNLGELVPLNPGEVQRLKESVQSRGLPWGFDTAPNSEREDVEAIVQMVLKKLRTT